MEVDEQIRLFREFIEQNYHAQLLEAVRKGQISLVLDFSELLKFNTELSDEILESPEELLKAAEIAVKEFDLPKKVDKFNVRLRNLPESLKVNISEIRSKHLNKFIWTDGIVRQKSDVRPHVTTAKFECPSCGNILAILQLDKKYKEPTRCSCGRKGKFKEISKELIDGQGLVLEEAPDDLDGGAQPKRINVFLKGDLVSPISERKSSPGSKVRLFGWVAEVPINLRTGGRSTKYDLILESNYLEPTEDDPQEMKINAVEEAQIKGIAKNPQVINMVAKSVAPSIYGHDKIKEALVLQLVGGCRKERPDGVVTRGDMHLLLIGDPGAGKSQLLKRVSKVAPKARFTSGKGASAAGLCVAPDSLILKNPGSILQIENLVENTLNNNINAYRKDIWQAKKVPKENVYTICDNLKLKTGKIEQFWKLKAPKDMISIKLQSGKEISLTQNTKLLTLEKGKLTWKKSEKFKLNEYLATARNLSAPKQETKQKSIAILSLISKNPIVYGVKDFLKEILKDVYKRQLAKKLSINENYLYHNWVNSNARGNIHLKELKKILNELKIDLTAIPENLEFSLYRGHKIKLLKFLNKDLLYFAGLVAGDGDLSKSINSTSIRFSNNSNLLLNKFQKIVKNQFNINCNISSKKSKKRLQSLRFSSLLITEILNKLGVPHSPKSNKIEMSNLLLNLPNNLIASYLKGIFDCDGSVVDRKGKGSSYLDLTSTSKNLIQKTQLVLLRWDIHSKIRKRKVKPGKIKSKYDRYVLEIRGRKNLVKFRDNVGFLHSGKRKKLENVINRIKKDDTNVDIIPETNEFIKNTLKKLKLTSKQVLGYKSSSLVRNIHSTNNLKKITNKIEKLTDKSCDELEKLKLLARSDIFWDKIVSIDIIKPTYEYVYDLTVKDSHNFLVNGIIVHNTASVVKDEFLGGWSLEAGTLVLANKGFAIIDELDKMNKEDRSSLHEAMEQQTVSVSKANIQATLRCETTLLAAANPKFGRFDPYDLIANQINLPPTLINRFDLIFPIKDLPSRERDEQTAAFILRLHQKPESASSEIDTDLLKKYFMYVRNKCHPQLSDEAIEEIKEYYIGMRNMGSADDSGITSIPITARQLEALVRLAEASAKLRLGKTVRKEDAQKAIELIDYSLNQIAKDSETGKIDIDRISSKITASQRSQISIVKELINNLENELGEKILPVEQLAEMAQEKNISQDKLDEVLEKLRRTGDIFEPKRGFIQRL